MTKDNKDIRDDDGLPRVTYQRTRKRVKSVLRARVGLRKLRKLRKFSGALPSTVTLTADVLPAAL